MLQQLRAFHPENARDSSKLKDEAAELLAKTEEFRKKTDDLIQLSDKVKIRMMIGNSAFTSNRIYLSGGQASRDRESSRSWSP